jgi:hypothetical protein
MLEGLDRGTGAGAEDSVSIDGRAGHNVGQAPLYVGDRSPRRPYGEGEDYRYAEISSTSCALGLAPIRRTSG